MSSASIRSMNRTLLLATAPFLGLLAWLLVSNVELALSDSAYPAHEAQSSDLSANTAPLM